MTRILTTARRRTIALALGPLLLFAVLAAGAPAAWAVAPDAPTDVSATAGDGSADVSWTAPAIDPASAITSYTVTAYLGAGNAGIEKIDPPALSTTFGGLTNGQTYTFTVFATNADGENSVESSPLAAVTPTGPPGAPTGVSATAGDGSADVSWSAPAIDGGSAITSYTVTAYLGAVNAGIEKIDPPALSTTFGGLTNGQTYTFRVLATNADGKNSVESSPSAAVAPFGPPGPPGAPENVIASGGNGSAIVTWDAPANDGGTPVTGYRVTPSGPGSVPAPTDTTARAVSITGLTNGLSYTFAVTATNATGLPGPAATSAAVTPGTVPGPPTAVTATPGDHTVTLTWSPPADSGGSPIIFYTVTARLDGVVVAAVKVAAPVTTATVTGLTNGVPHAFSVTATNSADAGPPSTPSTVATPAAPPVVLGATLASGYWMLSADGRVFSFGDAAFHGHPNGILGSVPAIDLEPTPTGRGYWILDEDGRIYAYGDATNLGNTAALASPERATSLSATPSGGGYWVFTNRGRVLNFGDAGFHGDMSGVALNGPVLDSIPTPSGNGYYMVASDGGIFSFGDARFYGSMGGTRLNAPVQSLVPDADGVGYWLVAADGGIFAFAAPFRGSMGATPLNQPITGMVRFGNGYLMVGTDGGIFNFSNRPFLGSLGASPPTDPIVSVAVLAG